MKSSVACLIILVLFISCSSGSLMMQPEYRDQRFKDCSVAVIFDASSVRVDAQKEVNDDLGSGDASIVFMKYFLKNFKSQLLSQSHIKHLKYLKKPLDSFFTSTSLDFNDSLAVPTQVPRDKVFQKKYPEYDFIINLIDLHAFIRDGKSYSTGGVGYHELNQLRFESKFYIWDNRKGKLVSNGLAVGKSDLAFGMNEYTWKHTLIEFTRIIKNASPFR